MSSLNLDQVKIEYRCEGNANLVVVIEMKPDDSKILCLPKEEETGKVSEIQENRCENYIEHAKTLILPFFGEEIVEIPSLINVNEKDIQKINSNVMGKRPAHRCGKIVKEIQTQAMLMSDCCMLPSRLRKFSTVGPVIAIEIKPKQGFIKNETLGFTESYCPEMCIYNLMQYYKLRKGRISKRSGYCPINLFSGCPSKMLDAIQELFLSPQNNFRIFQDQHLVYSEEKSGATTIFNQSINDMKFRRHLAKLIVQALLKPICHNKMPQNDSTLQKMHSLAFRNCTEDSFLCKSHLVRCCESVGDERCSLHRLPPDCVLNRILQLQCLDNLDVKTVHKFYLDIKDVNSGTMQQQMIGILPRCEIPNHFGEAKQMPSEGHMHYISRKVWEFLLALTMKDVSVMLVLQELDKDEVFEEYCMLTDDNDKHYVFATRLVDPDFKTLDKVEKVFQDRNKIVDNYLQMTSSIQM